MAEETKTEDKKTDEKKKSSSDGKSSINKKRRDAVSRSNKQREAVSRRAKEFKEDSEGKQKLTPKQKLQEKYKELYEEKPPENLTMDKLEKEIKKAEKDNEKKDKSDNDENRHVRPSGKEDAPDTTATLEPLAHAEPQDWLGSNRDPDVMLSVPNLGIDHIGLNVKNLYAHVDLNAQVLDLVKLHVGADVGIEEVDLQINNVRVQAMLKVKLEKVRDIVGDVVGFLDNNPEILTNLTGGLGKGLEGALSGKRGGIDQLSDNEKNKLRKMLKESDNEDQDESSDNDED